METMTPAMKTAAKTHRMLEFPVSSGNAHRVRESNKAEREDEEKGSREKAEGNDEQTEKNVEKELEESSEDKPLTEADILNIQNPLGVIMFGGHLNPPQKNGMVKNVDPF